MRVAASGPLDRLDDWDEFVARRYQQERRQEDFRDYQDAPAGVREFYRLNHENQTLDFVRRKREEYLPSRLQAPMWEALERLNELVDHSDPDTDLPQIAHALQTAEKIRGDGHPDWMQLVGLIHDAGKMLCFLDEPQWAVVGDTFPVGCAWSESVVYPKYFAGNPDRLRPELQTELGIYDAGCGFDGVLLSWGHDEYVYQVVRESKLPPEALAMLRYHSFYPWHREGAYQRLAGEHDRRMLPWVQAFNKYDLYSKGDAAPDVAALTPYYQSLIAKYLPARLDW